MQSFLVEFNFEALQYAYSRSHTGEQPPASENRQYLSSSKKDCRIHGGWHFYKLWNSGKVTAALINHL